MKLSAPIHVLRTRAKALKREQNIPLSSALDQTAAREGFATWSLLMSHREDLVPTRYSELLDYVNPGDLMLVAARPGIGKTIFSIGLGAQIVRDDQRLFLFSLVERESQMWERLGACGVERSDRVLIDCSDEICSDHIVSRIRAEISPGDMVLVDYLQRLDERRVTAPLQEQVSSLKDLAEETGCIVVFICQLQREVEERVDGRPAPADIRLPNPLGLGVFHKIVLLSRMHGQTDLVDVQSASGSEFRFSAALRRAPLTIMDAQAPG